MDKPKLKVFMENDLYIIQLENGERENFTTKADMLAALKEYDHNDIDVSKDLAGSVIRYLSTEESL